jgi:hypothetical protein
MQKGSCPFGNTLDLHNKSELSLSFEEKHNVRNWHESIDLSQI